MKSDTEKLLYICDAISEKLYGDREKWQQREFQQFVEHVTKLMNPPTCPPGPPGRIMSESLFFGRLVETPQSRRRLEDYHMFMAGYRFAMGRSDEKPYEK